MHYLCQKCPMEILRVRDSSTRKSKLAVILCSVRGEQLAINKMTKYNRLHLSPEFVSIKAHYYNLEKSDP